MSQTHSPRNTSKSAPAHNCGLPKRGPVKSLLIEEALFYHSSKEIGSTIQCQTTSI
jgi:hypothetical protein